jgi:hypothetical protein
MFVYNSQRFRRELESFREGRRDTTTIFSLLYLLECAVNNPHEVFNNDAPSSDIFLLRRFMKEIDLLFSEDRSIDMFFSSNSLMDKCFSLFSNL